MGTCNAIQKRLLCLMQTYKPIFYICLIFKKKVTEESQKAFLKRRSFNVNLLPAVLFKAIDPPLTQISILNVRCARANGGALC